MHARQRASVWLLVLILLVPGLASAVKKGRLIGKVVDPDGKPIEGVNVTATSEEIPGFKEVEVTDKKGIFKIDFEEINVVYLYQFDKVGFQTLKTEQTWRKDGTARHTFAMSPGQATLVEDLSPGAKPAAAVPAALLPPAIRAFNAGAAAFKAKDYPAAIARFEEALGHDPELRQAWSALSVAQLESGQYPAAAETAEKAIALGATDLLVLRTRWEAYRNLGDEAKTAEAQAAVEQAGILAEESKRVFNEAVRLVKADDHAAAFAKFKEASELDPNLQDAVLGVATTGLKIERYDEARAAAKALLEADPQNAEALRVRYNASLQLVDKVASDPAAEKEVFEALVGLAPIEPEAARAGVRQLALSAYDANDMVRAKERFAKLLEIDSGCADCHYYLGLIDVGEGANDSAKGHFERFLELAPDDARAGDVRGFLEYLPAS